MSNIIDDAIVKWRSKRINRKCIFCENFDCYTREFGCNSCTFFECKAKKFISVSELGVPLRFQIIRPFCQLFRARKENDKKC